MKLIQTSILTIALTTFAFAIMAPDAQAVPRNKVPGVGQKDKTPNPPSTPSDRDDDRKPYWRKKISG